jgi:hypothetical protein
MRELYRYVLAAMLFGAGLNGVRKARMAPAGPPGVSALWFLAIAWFAGSLLMLATTRLGRQARRLLRAKSDRDLLARRNAALTDLAEQGRLDEALAACRAALGDRPRDFPAVELSEHLRMSKPDWLRKDADNPLHGIFAHQDDLLRDGLVVWGHIVQANEYLFRHRSFNAPADIVYCTNPEEPHTVSLLDRIAADLFRLKSTIPADPAERAISDWLADERTPAFGEKVPDHLSPWAPCAMSTIFVDRRHLPDRKLSLSFFPVFVSATEPRYAMIVSSRYWPDVLRQAWAG